VRARVALAENYFTWPAPPVTLFGRTQSSRGGIPVMAEVMQSAAAAAGTLSIQTADLNHELGEESVLKDWANFRK
jgi:hypothetical protein